MTDKFIIQDEQYEFPYHHIPHIDDNGIPSCVRRLDWGWHYLCYMLHIKELVISLNPKSVLDVGCGDGVFAGMLKDKVEKVMGVDLSKSAINYAKAFYPNITFRCIDASEIMEMFDIVVAIEVMEHIPDNKITDFLTTIENKTRKGGYVIISVPTIVTPLIEKHYRHYDIKIFKEQLNNSGVTLCIEEVQYIYKNNFTSKALRKIFQNRWWIITSKTVRQIVWKYIWNHLRIANYHNGRNLLVVLKKY